MHKFSENVKVSVGIPSPIATSTVAVFYTAALKAGVGVDMAKYNNYAAVVEVVGATQWQGALTIQVAESTDNSTFSTAYLATATIATATTNTATSVELRTEQMSDGYRYLNVNVTPAAGTGNVFSAVNLQRNPRYAAV